MKHALDNLKIIDLTRVLGGPYATQIFADHLNFPKHVSFYFLWF